MPTDEEKYKFVLKVKTVDQALRDGLTADEHFIVAGSGKEFSDADIKRFLERGARRDRRCTACGEQVYLSPKSEELVAKMAEPKVLCLTCAMAMAKGEKEHAN